MCECFTSNWSSHLIKNLQAEGISGNLEQAVIYNQGCSLMGKSEVKISELFKANERAECAGLDRMKVEMQQKCES